MRVEQLADLVVLTLHDAGQQIRCHVQAANQGYTLSISTPCDQFEVSRFISDTELSRIQASGVMATTHSMTKALSQQIIDHQLGKGILHVR